MMAPLTATLLWNVRTGRHKLVLGTRLRRLAGTATLSITVLLSGLAATNISAYAASPLAAGGKAIIAHTDGDNIRIRESAGADANQIAVTQEGETVLVLAGPAKDKSGNAWYKVQAPEGLGWVSSDYLASKDSSTVSKQDQSSNASTTSSSKSSVAVAKPVSSADSKQSTASSDTKKAAPAAAVSSTKSSTAPTAKLSGFGKVSNTDGDPLRLRSSASQTGDVLKMLPANASVAIKSGPVTDKDNITWYQVTAQGTTGWAMAQYLAQDQSPSDNVAAKAPQAPARSVAAPAATAQPAIVVTSAPPVATAQPAIVVSPAPPAAVEPAPARAAAPPSVAKVAPVISLVPAIAPVVRSAAPVAQPASSVSSSASSSTSQAPQTSFNVLNSRGNSIVSVALRYVGYNYRFGGTTPSGFDCSGFVYYVLNRVGIPISRSMDAQAGSGTRISSSSLQPGDLLFFANTYKRGLSHAGIYIGNGRFVHAENESAGVAVSELWSSYWASHYALAVRP